MPRVDVELNLNCDYSSRYGSSAMGPCSGHGTCLSGVCRCDKYWTGRSDWISLEGYDCQYNTIAIRVEWAIIWLMAMYALKQCAKVARAEWTACKGHIGEIWKRTSGKMTISAVILSTFVLIVAIAKTVSPDQYIDPVDNPVIYVLYVLSSITFYWVTIYMTTMQLNLALKGMNSKKGGSDMDNIKKVMKVMDVKGYVDSSIIGVSAIIGFFKPEIGFNCLQTWRGLTMVVAVGQVWGMKKAVDAAFEGIGDGVTDLTTVDAGTRKVIELKRKMKALIADSIKAALINGTLSIAFGLYPALFGSWSYWAPAQYVLAIGIVIKGVKVMVKKVDKKSKVHDAGKTTVNSGSGMGNTTVASSSSSSAEEETG